MIIVEEPIFSNTNGKITFNGGVPNPGFNGSSGYIATITFKAKKVGISSVIFTDAAVRANDGLGTDILSSKNNSSIEIVSPKIPELPITINDKSVAPSKPIIVSDTHPNQEVWYSRGTGTFSWNIPSGVTSLQTLFNKIPNSTPTITYDNSVTEKTLNNLSDGTFYFHLRFFNSAGGSPIAHYKVNIDNTSPVLSTPVVRLDKTHGVVKLKAIDLVSGVDHYSILIDNNLDLKILKEELVEDEFHLPVLSEGEHNLLITVYDRAGNYTESNLVFKSPSISSPVLTLSAKEITNGEHITISGKTDYPGQQIEVTLIFEDQETKKYTQTISQDGSFSIVTDKIKTTGVVSIWAETIFSSSIKSEPSFKSYLKVNETEAVKITLAIFYPLIGLVIVIASLLLLIILLYLGWHKFFGLRKKVSHELEKTTEDVHKAMMLLKEELRDQLKTLEKIKEDRALNKKEEIIFSEIQKNIDGIEDFIEKKLKKLM